MFPCGDEMVAIIDDREDVWSKCPNLIHVKPYVFFAGTADINAPPPRPSQTLSTSSTTHPLKPDGMPFKVRHITSSKNNNMKPPVSIAAHHHKSQSSPKSTPLPCTSENNIIGEQLVDEKAMATSTNEATTECYNSPRVVEGKQESHATTQADALHDSNVQSTEEIAKSGDPPESVAITGSDGVVCDLTGQSSSNENNNNDNGDDPKTSDKTKEGDSSSSSSSSSSEGDDEERGGEEEREEEGNGSGSSSSSSGIDDNLFESLGEKPGGLASPELGDTGDKTKTTEVLDNRKMDVAALVSLGAEERRETVEKVGEMNASKLKGNGGGARKEVMDKLGEL